MTNNNNWHFNTFYYRLSLTTSQHVWEVSGSWNLEKYRELPNFILWGNERGKVPNAIFLFKDIGVLLKGRHVGVLTFRTMWDGKVHLYQKVIL